MELCGNAVSNCTYRGSLRATRGVNKPLARELTNKLKPLGMSM